MTDGDSMQARPATTARERFLALEGRPLLLSNWERALFIHYAVPAPVLQPHVSFELDLHEGRAYVSLVAFTMTRMRPAFGGPLTSLLFHPFREQRFLNLRTYVRHEGEPGIHFLAEWMSDWLCVQLGPFLYGLPYRHGCHNFQHHHETGAVEGRVTATDATGILHYTARVASPLAPCTNGSLDAFLLERYTAFTHHTGPARRFRIWHEPWDQCRVEATVQDDSLIAHNAPWWSEARYVGANYSPGAFGIWMGRPRKLATSAISKPEGRGEDTQPYLQSPAR